MIEYMLTMTTTGGHRHIVLFSAANSFDADLHAEKMTQCFFARSYELLQIPSDLVGHVLPQFILDQFTAKLVDQRASQKRKYKKYVNKRVVVGGSQFRRRLRMKTGEII